MHVYTAYTCVNNYLYVLSFAGIYCIHYVPFAFPLCWYVSERASWECTALSVPDGCGAPAWVAASGEVIGSGRSPDKGTGHKGLYKT
jgi:hypothetical protein